jgi:hypothetical protein
MSHLEAARKLAEMCIAAFCCSSLSLIRSGSFGGVFVPRDVRIKFGCDMHD